MLLEHLVELGGAVGMVDDGVVLVGEEDERDGGDAKPLDIGRLETESVGGVEDVAKGVASNGLLPGALFHVEGLGDDAELAFVFVLVGNASEFPQEVVATGHPCGPKGDEGVGFGRFVPQLDVGAIGTGEGEVGEFISDGAVLGLGDLCLKVEQVVVVGMVWLKDFKELVEFLGADGLFLHEVAVEEIDGDGRFWMIDDVGACLCRESRGAEVIGVGTELGEFVVGLVAFDGVATQVVGSGFIGEVVAWADKDDLFHAVGEDEVVGGELVGLAPIEKGTVLDGEGVDAGMVGREVVEVELACLHVGDMSAKTERITSGTTGCE